MDRDKATAQDRAIDHDLWRRAHQVLGRLRAVVLMTCPRRGEETLVWPGVKGAGARCLNRKCGLAYQDFEELVTGQEAYLAAKREEEMRQLVERHDTYKRVRGAIRQVRHG
ncbi:MAG: hypothetical protein ACM3X3_09010 [Betaproteobacteria bacterium]